MIASSLNKLIEKTRWSGLFRKGEKVKTIVDTFLAGGRSTGDKEWNGCIFLHSGEVRIRSIIAAAVAMLVVVFQLACSNGDLKGPEKVVDSYCTLDFNGARLTDTAEIEKLTTFKNEPGWDICVVCKSYRIGSSQIRQGSASVVVRYSLFGELDGSDFNEKSEDEIITFTLKRSKQGWKIISPLMPPHVSKNSMIQHFQKLIAAEEDRADVKSAIKILRGLR
jgi:hypothetical protein